MICVGSQGFHGRSHVPEHVLRRESHPVAGYCWSCSLRSPVFEGSTMGGFGVAKGFFCVCVGGGVTSLAVGGGVVTSPL